MPLTLTRAGQRLIGTLLGVLLFALLLRLDIAGAWLVLMVVGLEFMIELVIAKNYGLGLLFITPLALVISTANVPGDPLSVVRERVTDTFLGALIALVVLFAAEWLRRRMTRGSKGAVGRR